MADNKAAFGTFPQMKPRRSKQDREAAKNFPVDVARGFVSGALGMPGDIESLARLPYELITGNESPTILPTSSDIEKRLPFKSDSPLSQAATGLGQIGGGFYTGPLSGARAAMAVPKAVMRAGKDFAQAAGQPAVNVIKPKGGNWLTGSVEGALKDLKTNSRAAENLEEMKRVYPPEVMARMSDETRAQVERAIPHLEKQAALNNWIDRNLGNYVKKEMATPEDPVRKLAEQGIVHIPTEQVGINRYRAPQHREAYGGEQLGKSEAAQAWEDASDVAINAPTARNIRQNEALYRENPWTEKLSPEDRVYALNKPGYREAEINGLGFDHIIDILKQDLDAGRIRPEQLSKVSMDQAVRRTYEFDQEAAKKMREAQIKNTAGMPIHKEYPEGYRWIELTSPKELPEEYSIGKAGSKYYVQDAQGRGYTLNADSPDEAIKSFYSDDRFNVLQKALKYEGDTMGHCVGGYCPDVLEGRSRIYSLRDAKGEPHVTIEVNPSSQRVAPRHEEILAEMKASGVDTSSLSESAYDAAYEQALQRVKQNRPPEIKQIKGKQNAAPKEQYLPFVQDFVRGGKWSEVGDLKNTGLEKIGSKYLTTQEAESQYKPLVADALNFLDTHPALERQRAAQKARDEFRGDVMSPEYRELERSAGESISKDVPYTYRELRALLSTPEDWVERGETIYRPISTAIEQIERAKRQFGIDTPPPAEGFKRGGKVSVSDNCDCQMMEVMDKKLAGGGLLKGLKTAAKAAKGTQDVLPAAEREANLSKFLSDSKIKERLYHATPKNFTEFKPGGADPTISGPAIWLSSDAKHQPAMHNISAGRKGEFREGVNVMPVHVQAKNPLVLDDPTMIDWAQAVFANGSREFPELLAPKWVDEVQKEGYDSIMFSDPRRTGQTHEVIMFEPSKIKSAIGNRGTYDTSSPELNKAEGGAVYNTNPDMSDGGQIIQGPAFAGGGAVKGAIKGLLKIKPEKVEHPLVFPRAEPKGREDIRPIAQRIAEQVTGDFVRQNPKVTTNPAGKSRKQWEREQSMPLETRNVVPERDVLPIDYEQHKGSYVVGVPGDPSLGGVAKRGSLDEPARSTVELTRVGDITPDNPVPLFGGPRYGNDENFWASNLGAAQPVQNNVNALVGLEEAPVLGKYIKMAPDSANFALHNLDSLLAIQQPERLSKDKRRALTEIIRKGNPKYGEFPHFAGFDDPAEVLLHSQFDSNLRKYIAETLTKPTITDPLGLPNGLDVVAAITHPELRNLETGISGFSVGRMTPGAKLKKGESDHPTYDTNIPGALIGRSKYPTPYEIAFPDTTAYARSQLKPGVQEFNMMKLLGPRERIDQQYIDEMKMFEELMKEYTGKKKGGAVSNDLIKVKNKRKAKA